MVDPHPAAVVAWNVIEKEDVKRKEEGASVRNQRMGMKMKIKEMKLRYKPRSIYKDCA